MEKIMMKCGHIANAITAAGKPCCAICLGLTPDAEIPMEEKPSLEGRKALCNDCGRIVDSDYKLPFFEYRPNEKYDRYYCGCQGWD